jgi:hypothetical protein
VVRFEPHVFASFEYCQRGMGGQKLDHHARMGGIEMLDQNESHAALGGKRREEGPKGPKPTSGGADRDHSEVGPALRNYALLGSVLALCRLWLGTAWWTTRRHGLPPLSFPEPI